MKNEVKRKTERIKQSFEAARREKPAYGELYPLLEALFLSQLKAKESLKLKPFNIAKHLVETKWHEGFPLLMRWDFSIDVEAAQSILTAMAESIPATNQPLKAAHSALMRHLHEESTDREAFWKSFLQHEWEPWEEWVSAEEVDLASLLFWARSALRPSLEWTAEDLTRRFPLPDSWLKGYCPICGSLPSLLYLEKEGSRKAHCSWCGTDWVLHRLQCPYCDNRYHESLGYIYIETEPRYRVQYCRLCNMYFKLVDTRERMEPALLDLEEWTGLHLDLLAQRHGWKQPPSPSPTVYKESE